MIKYGSLRAGEVYEMEAAKLLRAIPKGKAGAIISDPPFFVGLNTRRSNPSGFGSDPWESEVRTMEDAARWSNRLAAAAAHALRPGGAFIVMGSLQSASSLLTAAGHHGLVWRATISVLWNQGKPRVHSFGSLFDIIIWMVREGAKPTWRSEKKAIYSNVLVCDKIQIENRLHVTQKPLEITNFLVSLLTRNDDLIVDPFCGSGSTLVSAKLAGRPWIGGDTSEESVDIATMRTTYADDEEQGVLRMWRNGSEEEL